MSIFRLVEGWITTREVRKLEDFSFCTAPGFPHPAGVDVLFDFGALRRDVTIWPDQEVEIKFNLTSKPIFRIDPGPNRWLNEYADKVYITFNVPTNIRIFANS